MEEASWEFLDDFAMTYPEFKLQDKLFVQVGNTDM
uniref:Uncharacterized protein n=1 Tax=Rhizophora mucronata TaxID=61149 RepID=A0A2P2NFE0_RHIMU